ncbi:MAG: iron-containing alcohol dehydrogenase [Clostridium sp.]|nr:MAG: iron-containing alcohol dehydrogenase [Clostridium sp.]
MENVEVLKKNKDVEGSDVLFAIGGGKAIDTVKMLGYELNKPVFTFPTISSTPAAVSDVAYIDKIPYFIKDIVKHTFINDDIIINAPYMYFSFRSWLYFSARAMKFYLNQEVWN